MNDKNKFLDALGEIDAEYLKEHIEYKKRPSDFFRSNLPIIASATAAAIVISVGIPFLVKDNNQPNIDTLQGFFDTDETGDVSDVERYVTYSQLSGVAKESEYDTLPADGEVRLSGELKSVLSSDENTDSLYAVAVNYTSSKFIECSSDPVMVEKAEDVLGSYEERLSDLRDSLLEQLEGLNEDFKLYFYNDVAEFAKEDMRRTLEITAKYSPSLEEIKEKYPNDYEERSEYQELQKQMSDEIAVLNAELRQKYLDSQEEWRKNREDFFEEYQNDITKILDDYKEKMSKIIEDKFKSTIANGVNDDMSEILDSWFASETYVKYQNSVEKAIRGDSDANPEKYFRQWFEEYSQQTYKEARNRITKEVYGIDDEGTVCAYFDEINVDYSLLTVKTLSEEEMVIDDNDRIITFMTQEQIENLTAPETIGIDLELAPNDWQDEDSDFVVYSKIRG